MFETTWHLVSAQEMFLLIMMIALYQLNQNTNSTSSQALRRADRVKVSLPGWGYTASVTLSQPAPDLPSPAAVCCLPVVTLQRTVELNIFFVLIKFLKVNPKESM